MNEWRIARPDPVYSYIELNPVRARMVRLPREYRWSSYGANAEGKSDRLLSAHEMYLGLGRDEASRRAAYRELFKAHVDEEELKEIRQATNGNYALGGTRFQAQIAKALGRRVVRGKAGRPAAGEDAVIGRLFE